MKPLNKGRENMQLNNLRFTATHIAKPHMLTPKPKLVKECVCPNARGTAKLINKMIDNNKVE